MNDEPVIDRRMSAEDQKRLFKLAVREVIHEMQIDGDMLSPDERQWIRQQMKVQAVHSKLYYAIIGTLMSSAIVGAFAFIGLTLVNAIKEALTK